MAFKKKIEEKTFDVDASMQGTLSFKDPVNLRINGKFEGILETRGNLTVSSTAQVSAEITGDNIIIGGRIKGRITAKERLTLLPSAIVEGDIYPAKLNVAEGAVFEGKCSMLRDFLNADELAKYLEVDLNSIMEWANAGKVPGHKEGDGWKFERKAIDSWVASGKIGK
ncbi:MAG: cell shape determination protein CcmA [Candidatus Omnitrophica bacterium CG08_land_8_20_14_0_20_41_16]|uniref:Cell shape determination protein CcmA n=1 Tax=Candidatus Sherwoodlollariibacterium unditelluris TaxID=1974757 RepID=A0A2G9YI32_9BACT|nr:MAG: cell shape determination protein CcmA [Candidatus Omnitrophica bacterium CG23_combo_of_CG06-09_8_20_14_all_41_10]PIS33547.1 MAG: cell shape determination protein CcmA [Candidatus Omnitrophica bacterium CG08_land_8_20_14_0_20_41_16]